MEEAEEDDKAYEMLAEILKDKCRLKGWCACSVCSNCDVGIRYEHSGGIFEKPFGTLCEEYTDDELQLLYKFYEMTDKVGYLVGPMLVRKSAPRKYNPNGITVLERDPAILKKLETPEGLRRWLSYDYLSPFAFSVLCVDISALPLFINEEDIIAQDILKWRLSIGK